MNRDPRQALATLRALARSGDLDDMCDELGVRLLVAFGSSTEDEGLARDLDLAALLDLSATTISVTVALQRRLRFDAVDLMDLRRAGIVARDQALRTAIPLYERRPGLFAEQQMMAAVRRMDTAWLRRLDLELMAG